MFYSNNDSYMQDLYFYNQNPNTNTATYNPCMNNMCGGMQNANMMNNMNGMCMGQNANMMNNMNQTQNLNNLYPSIYRIITPVAARVVANSNCQFLNEDVLNNMVDTVYNIVDGQIEYDDDTVEVAQTENVASTSNSVANSSSSGASASMGRNTDARQTTTPTVSPSRSHRRDSLLRDIIRIILLREIFSRNRFHSGNSQGFMQPPFLNTQMYNW